MNRLLTALQGVRSKAQEALDKIGGRDYEKDGVLRASRKRIRQFRENLQVGKRVLEIGTGSGVLAEMAFQKGAKEVVAVDINPAAVAVAKSRVPQATVLESDLFAEVEGLFDTIIFAPPWSDGKIEEYFDHAIYDCGVVSRFFKEVKAYLAQDGLIWIQYSDESPGNYSRLQQAIAENGFKVDASWSYEDWALLVQRTAKIILLRIRAV